MRNIFKDVFKPTKEKVSNGTGTTRYSGGINLARGLSGDLTKPYIYRGYNKGSYIPFGVDNLFPSIIDQMYYYSPLHSSIIDFQVNSAIGGSYTLTPFQDTTKGRIEVKKFERVFKLKRLLKGIALDYKMHKRFHLLVEVEEGEIVKTKRVLPSQVRYNADQTRFFVSDSWEYNHRATEYGALEEISKDGIFMYSYIDLSLSAGQDIYPLDKTVSAFNWIYLDGESSSLQKDNIDMSIFGGIVIRMPSNFKSDKEFHSFKKGITDKQGKITPVLVLTGDGMENVPEVESFPKQENDKAFEHLDRRIDDKICQAHSIKPVIMGIERPGALGSGSDIREAYPIWEANVLKPFREEIEGIVDELMSLFGLNAYFHLNEFKVINKEEAINNQK